VASPNNGTSAARRSSKSRVRRMFLTATAMVCAVGASAVAATPASAAGRELGGIDLNFHCHKNYWSVWGSGEAVLWENNADGWRCKVYIGPQGWHKLVSIDVHLACADTYGVRSHAEKVSENADGWRCYAD